MIYLFYKSVVIKFGDVQDLRCNVHMYANARRLYLGGLGRLRHTRSLSSDISTNTHI